jgi:hypothetical protein
VGSITRSVMVKLAPPWRPHQASYYRAIYIPRLPACSALSSAFSIKL